MESPYLLGRGAGGVQCAIIVCLDLGSGQSGDWPGRGWDREAEGTDGNQKAPPWLLSVSKPEALT